MTENKKMEEKIGFDAVFERRWKLFERIAWTLAVIFIFVTATGALGDGYLSHKTATSSSMTIEYQSPVHYNSPTKLTIKLNGNIDVSSTTEIHLDRNFLDHF